MSNERIKNNSIQDYTISKEKIVPKSITLEEISQETIDNLSVADLAVTTDKLGPLAVTTPKINDSAVTTEKILDQAVTYDKLDINSVFLPEDDSFIATTELTYTLAFQPRSKFAILVFKNGVAIGSDYFSLLDSDLTFNSGILTTGDEVYIKDVSVFAVATNTIAHEVVFTATTELAYDLGTYVEGKTDVLVVLNGLILHSDDFSISGDYIYFTVDILTEGDEVLIKVWKRSAGNYNVTETIYANAEPADPIDMSFTTIIGVDTYMLDETPLNKTGTFVFVNGIVLQPEDWTLVGRELTLDNTAIDLDYENVIHVKSLMSYNYIKSITTPESLPSEPKSFTTIIASEMLELDGRYLIELDFSPASKACIICSLNGVIMFEDDYDLSTDIIYIHDDVIIEEGWIFVVNAIYTCLVLSQIDISSIQSNFSLTHDGINGYIANNYGDLYIDTIHPTEGITGGAIRSQGKIYNAVWNDYADYWDKKSNTNEHAGMCYSDYGKGLELSKKNHCKNVIGICSDTFGHGMGFRENALPIAVAGFVLASVDREYKSGTLLTNDYMGYLTKASILDTIFNRCVGKYIRKEVEKTFNGKEVRGRSWVKVV